ncbi:MAG: glycosyltransferase family protein [Candidatus Nitrosocaldus sp.]
MMSRRAYIGVYGVGLGHASRMLMVAERLKAHGYALEFSSFGDAVDYIDMHGYRCNIVPEVEFGWNPISGFNVKRSIMKIPENLFNFTRQLRVEMESISRFRPDVVISDTRLSTLFASIMLGIPCLVILNQIKLLLSPRLREFRIVRLFEDMLGELFGMLWSRGNTLIAPDLPPPYTISEQNLWYINNAFNVLEYSGFMIPRLVPDEARVKKVARVLGFNDGYYNNNYDGYSSNGSPAIVFVHISGPSETKHYIIRSIVEGLSNMNGHDGNGRGNSITVVVSEGKPKGDTVPRRIRNGWYFEWCPYRDELFSISKVIVMRGGHSTIAQAIHQGKPLICIPIENHSEQLGNASKVERLGMGMMLREKYLRAEHIYEAIYNILNDYSRYEKNVMHVRDVATKMGGVEDVVNRAILLSC